MSARHFFICMVMALIAVFLSPPAFAPVIVFVAVCVDAVCVAIKESKK